MIDEGVVEIADTKIARVGRAVDFSEMDLRSRTLLSAAFITPGLIDAHTHLGIWRQGVGLIGHDLNEMTEIVTPHLRAIDSLDPRDSGFTEAYQSGVTAVVVCPGSATLIAGQLCIVKTYGQKLPQMLLKHPIGLKASFGAVPLSKYGGKGPNTRMGAIGMLRETFIACRNYLNLRKVKGNDYTRNLRMEALELVLERKIPLHIHVHEAHSLGILLRLAEEFSIDIVLVHATEATEMAEDIAQAHVPVIFGPALMSQQTAELQALSFDTPGNLYRAGVTVANTTDHGEVPIGYLLLCAALSQKHGLPYLAALESVTSVPARICGVSDSIGHLKQGLDADVVMFDGDPLDIRTHVLTTFINGRPVYASEHLGGNLYEDCIHGHREPL